MRKYCYILLLSILNTCFAQITETEPNDLPTDSGTHTIIQNGEFVGEIEHKLYNIKQF